jgi:hypothetical protein
MPKQTAVEWLFTHLVAHLDWSKVEDRELFRKLKTEALAMEKEQIVDAFTSGEYNSVEYFNAKNPKQECSENYYNETYKGGNNG